MGKASILDQPAEVESIDKGGMLAAYEQMPRFCRDAFRLANKLKMSSFESGRPSATIGSPRNVIVLGMGGSGIGGELLKDWLRDRASIPIEVCRNYVLPAYAGEESLVIAVSYSGETEETLSAFLQAAKRGCMMVAISSGGHMKDFSRKLRVPHMAIPSSFPAPRAAIAYTFVPLVVLMEKTHIVSLTSEEIEEAFDVLSKVGRENALQIPLKDNKAKKLALKIEGTVPVVYGHGHFGAVARRLKCQFNENSKVPSRFDTFSELDHNEIVGWEAPTLLTKTFSVILLRDPDEPPEMKRRIEITKQIISPKVSEVVEIHALGKHRLTKMLSAMYLGGLASIYLALLRKVDPTPTQTITRLKTEMKSEFDMVTRLEREIEGID